jgi:hypothetical protein
LAEIPSTIDLIMARTRGMTLSPEQQEVLRRERLEKLAKGYRLKLLGNPGRGEEILSTISEESLEDRELLEWLVWKEMVENLPPNAEILQHIELMQNLPESRIRSAVLGELRAAFKTRLKNEGPDRKKIIIREKKKLAAAGISGSAVVPKIPRHPDSDGEFAAALNGYKKRLLQDGRGVRP